ncbi:glutathione S-transferase [Macrolepiota fuliginosa MF-IS2]|uniref:glutathione transferase n=1 Tax=Macrolepiota fuliginosa MF-IS2 TaxID=1400762 RepID=A0A9P6BYV1_9AGAR|nr:glutathione S-transferase [Macrolepiota fuliginosa MF-IS2]
MVLKLYGFPASTATRRVAQILHEKEVPFEFVEIDRASNEHKSPAYLEKQPFGQVPYIDDEGFILYESRAISRYIATKWADRGAPLIPTELKALALFEQAASIEAAHFDRPTFNAVFEKVIKPKRGLGPTNEAVFEEALKTLQTKLDVYEIILSKTKYLGGNEITLADFFHLPFGSLIPATGVDVFSTRPNFSRWFNDITTRPSWLAVKDGVVSKPSY